MTTTSEATRRAGVPNVRHPPDRIDPLDLALLAVATHKLARLTTRSRVTSAVRAPFTHFQHDADPGEVDEEARGHGIQRAIGELLICPYRMSMWFSGAFTAGLLTAPRVTRWVATALTIDAGADCCRPPTRAACCEMALRQRAIG